MGRDSPPVANAFLLLFFCSSDQLVQNFESSLTCKVFAHLKSFLRIPTSGCGLTYFHYRGHRVGKLDVLDS